MSKNNPKKQAHPASELAASSCRNQSNPPPLTPAPLEQAQQTPPPPLPALNAEDQDEFLSLPTSLAEADETTSGVDPDQTAKEQTDLKLLSVLQPQQPTCAADHKNLSPKFTPAKNEKFDQQLSIDLINPNNITVSSIRRVGYRVA